jgi:putative selenate reductase
VTAVASRRWPSSAPIPSPRWSAAPSASSTSAGSIFDLPVDKGFYGSPRHDLTARFHRHAPSSPLGPAAGPQTQMAQNLVLSWLAGCRVMELKTVQIKDDLQIPRPCIDMATVGYNVEWSQELRLPQSLDEYVKGAMLIEILRATGKLPLAAGFERTIYDMSVGYDLAGIQSPAITAFIAGLKDARPIVERLRGELTGELAAYRDLPDPAVRHPDLVDLPRLSRPTRSSGSWRFSSSTTSSTATSS